MLSSRIIIFGYFKSHFSRKQGTFSLLIARCQCNEHRTHGHTGVFYKLSLRRNSPCRLSKTQLLQSPRPIELSIVCPVLVTSSRDLPVLHYYLVRPVAHKSYSLHRGDPGSTLLIPSETLPGHVTNSSTPPQVPNQCQLVDGEQDIESISRSIGHQRLAFIMPYEYVP